MRVSMAALALVPVLLAAACTTAPAGHSRTSPAAQRPVDYVNSALDLMREHAYYADRVDWVRLRQQADAAVATARSLPDTYPEITAALDDLGDHHSHLVPPTAVRQGDSESLPFEDQPTGSQITRSVTLLNLPAERAAAPHAVAMYLALAESVVTAGERAGTCGWIVDLRQNPGGSSWPMLAAVAPLLGNGVVGSFVFADGTRQSWSLRAGTPADGDHIYSTLHDPVPLAGAGSAPVAVLTDENTASAGEAVAVAFRGRPDTRSFGAPTAGVPTGNATYPLSDGAKLAIMGSLDADRTGHAYNGPLPPDQPTPDEPAIGQDDPTLITATDWLQEQPACASHQPR